MSDHSIRMVYKSGKGFYTGKVIGNTFYKNFKLGTSVLWKDHEFGINIEVFDYLQQSGIESIVYVDTSAPSKGYKISTKKFDETKTLKEYRFGKQYFVSVDNFDEIKAPKLPYVKKTIEVKEQND